MLRNLIDGLTNLGTAQSLAYLFGGSIVGMLLGVVPGVGGLVILSVLLSFIYHISVTGAICLFVGSYSASFFSASVTSILLNTPAHPEAFAVTFDGFPMAQRGEAGRALGISASATCVGGFVGCACLVGFIQIMNDLPGIFHPPEYVALIAIALLLVGTLGADSVSKAVISAGIGLMISCIGSDPTTGTYRFTFGAIGLYTGLSLVALALGLFAVPQMILIFGTASTIARQDMMGNDVDAASQVELGKGFGKQVIQGIGETFHHWVALIRAGLIGVVCGIIPGIGGFAANFLSYGVAQQSSKHRELFGTGIPEGIIAPEGSSLSKEAGAMVPIIGLGIPGGVGGALFLAALTIKGIKVGYGFAQAYPSLPYEIMWVIALAGFIGTVTGLLLAPFLARVTNVPGPLIVPIIMALAVIGPFVAEVSFFTVMEVLAFSIVGLLLRRLRYSLASFAIGLVLGPTFETNIFLTHTIYHGVSFLERPLTDILLFILIGVMILKSVQLRRDAKRKAIPINSEDPLIRADQIQRRQQQQHPYPLLAVLCSFGIAGTTIFMAVFGVTHYSLTNALLPLIASSLAGLGSIWRLPSEIRGYGTYRRSKKLVTQVAEQQPSHLGERELVGIAASARGQTAENGIALESDSERSTNDQFDTTERITSSRSRLKLPAVRDKAWGIHGQYTREVVGLVWFIGLIAGCYVFGFEVGIPTFVALYGLTATRRVFPRMVKRCIFAATSAAVMWGATFEMLNALHLSFTPLINFH